MMKPTVLDNMKRLILPLLLLLVSSGASLAQQVVEQMLWATPYPVPHTLPLSDKNVAGEQLSDAVSLLKQSAVRGNWLRTTTTRSQEGVHAVPTDKVKSSKGWIHQSRWQMQSSSYFNGHIEISAGLPFALFVNGEYRLGSTSILPKDSTTVLHEELRLAPGYYDMELRLYQPADSAAGRVSVCYEGSPIRLLSARDKAASLERFIDLELVSSGKSLSNLRTSPSGRYLLYNVVEQKLNKTTDYRGILLDTRSNKIVADNASLYSATWHKTRDLLYRIEGQEKDYRLVRFDPLQAGSDEIIAEHLPTRQFSLSADGRCALMSIPDKAPAKNTQAWRVIDPDDRQAGFRDSNHLNYIDLETGLATPLSFGGRGGVNLFDTHPTTGKLLLAHSHSDWAKYPFYFTTIYQFDPASGQTDTLLLNEEDIAGALYLPTGNQLLVLASPNSFGGVGKIIPQDQIANGYERELFLYDIKTHKATCLTKEFSPSVSTLSSVTPDGGVFFTAENGSRLSLYHLDSKRREISQVQVPGDMISDFSADATGRVVHCVSSSADHFNQLYRVEGGRVKLLYDLDAEQMKGVHRPTYKDWAFKASDGTPIDCWYYLPSDFDPSKKYPMLVYYYGGTSPTRRSIGTRWSLPMYADYGYVVLTLNPSGTTGYGQEFSARHVNAWGIPTAGEIIEAVTKFSEEHSFINKDKIGCFGASYGGFMTQYLLTQTDVFATGISHAGISNITNYWGSGYWGMGYTSVAAAKSYPWSNPEIFVERSPLFNADKISSPLLLLHGDSDTNVPTAESVNMYNALKILDHEVEFVLFAGEDHVIADPDQRIRWTKTILAWFAKQLQDNPSWWNELYPEDK